MLTLIASCSSQHAQAVVNAGAITPLIRLLSSENVDIAAWAARTLGSIADGPSEQIQAVIDAGMCLWRLLV